MKKILFICGSLNQTTMMHKISGHLEDYDCYFTPYYSDGLIGKLTQSGYLDFTILSGSFRAATEKYLSNSLLYFD